MEEIRLPRFDVNDIEGEIKAVYVKDGDFVKESDPLFEVETTKAVETISSPVNGYIHVLVQEGQVYRFGHILALIFDTEEELQNYLESEHAELEKSSQSEIKATKKAIEKAKELGVDLRSIKKAGVIMVKDVVEFHRSHTQAIPRPTPRFKYDLERVVVIGAGRGADVVLDILLDDPDKWIVGLVDDNVKEYSVLDIPVIFNSVDEFPKKFDRSAYDTVIISIGATLKTMQIRHKIFEHYKKFDIKFTNAIAKSAEIRRGVKIGEGNIIGGGAYIGTLTRIGTNNLIAYGAFIGHHNVIGDSNLIAPGVVTSGSVRIGNNCIVSAGVTFMNRVAIGENVVLPVGYKVVQDIESNTIVKFEV